MTTTLEHMLKDHLCELTSEGDACEVQGCGIIPDGHPVYFFSDGGYDSREGTYLCRAHACEWLGDAVQAAEALSQGMREHFGFPQSDSKPEE